MNKTRTATKWFAALAVVGALFMSATTAPAQAKPIEVKANAIKGDTGWG